MSIFRRIAYVKMLVYRYCGRSIHTLDEQQVLYACVANIVYSPESLYEPFLLDLAHTRYIGKSALGLGAFTLVAVKGYGKSMRLVPYALDELEGVTVAWQKHRLRLTREEYLLFALGKTYDFYTAKPRFLYLLHDATELSLATVDDDKVGFIRNRFVLLLVVK